MSTHTSSSHQEIQGPHCSSRSCSTTAGFCVHLAASPSLPLSTADTPVPRAPRQWHFMGRCFPQRHHSRDGQGRTGFSVGATLDQDLVLLSNDLKRRLMLRPHCCSGSSPTLPTLLWLWWQGGKGSAVLSTLWPHLSSSGGMIAEWVLCVRSEGCEGAWRWCQGPSASQKTWPCRLKKKNSIQPKSWELYFIWWAKLRTWEFPGSQVVRTWCFHFQRCQGLVPSQGSKIPQTMQFS